MTSLVNNFFWLTITGGMENLFEFTILVLVLYWIFTTRVNKMIDIVANRVFDAYSRLAPNSDDDKLSTLTNLKKFSYDHQQKRAISREIDKQSRDKELFSIKENKVRVTGVKKRPFVGLSCLNCVPESRDSLVNQVSKDLSLINILNHDAFIRRKGIIQRTFHHLGQVYELKKFDYPKCEGTVLQDERLKRAIEKTALQQYHDEEVNDEEFYLKILKNNEKRARKLLHDMRSTLSDFLLRFTSWVLYKLLPCFLTSIVVHPGQIEMLKKAGDSGLPLIFLPLHKSHLDYILVTFILLNNNIRSPLVAAGDNLRIPFFGSLLRGLGAFFIKRRIDPIMGRKDHVYKAVLHTYMNECLRAGHNIEFFLEGGRTRTGKSCMPKYGIFSVIVDAYMDGTIEDALLVPISMNYEKLIDGNFVREQLGQPKEMETFGAAIKGIWHVLNSNYGSMRIDFNQPFSLRELVRTFNTSGKMHTSNGVRKLKSNASTTSLYGTDIVSEEHKQLVQSISNHILYDCTLSTSIMSTNAIAFLLLNKFRNGTNIDDLVIALDDLRHELTCSNTDMGFSGDSFDVIRHAVKLLGPGLVRTERIDSQEIIKPVAMLPNVIELAYYSNCMMQHYVLKAVMSAALSSIDISLGVVKEEELIDRSLELCNILQYEFIFCKPCQSLELTLSNVLEDMATTDELFITKEVNPDTFRNRKLTEELLCDEVIEYKPQEIQINTEERCLNQFAFLKNLLNPWIEPYCTTAFCLEKLVGRTLLEEELIKEILDEMKAQLSEGNISCGESICADPIKNCLKLFQNWDLMECHAEKRVRLIYMKEQHDNSTSVQQLSEKLNKFRGTFNFNL